MTKKTILYNKARVTFWDRLYNPKYNRNICPLCLKKIHEGDKIYLIVNNHILFPNIFVHKTCVGSKRECVRSLIASYKIAEKVIKKYRFWFPEKE